MATETEKLYNENAGTATAPAAAETTPAAPAETSASPSNTPYTTGNATLDSYNTVRVNQINQLYDTQRDAALGQLEAANKRTMSDWQAAYDKITPGYQQSRNALGATAERERRNNDIRAAVNGLNSGAGSQMRLAASNVYQQNQAALEKAEKDALAEANRQQITLKEQAEAEVADALAKNDAQRAAALLNEYGQQYDRMANEAKQLAAYGDFSLYKTLYGDAAAAQMQRAWDLQNPQLAYTLGRITADEYFQMTGKYPPGYGGSGGGSSSGGGRSYGYGGGSGGGEETSTMSAEDLKALRAANPGATDAQIRDAAKQAGVNLPVRTVAESYGYTLQNNPMSKAQYASAANQTNSNNTHGGSGGTFDEKKTIGQKIYGAITSLLK